MIISLGTFFIVLNFSFFRLFRGKGEKYSPKWKIITSITRHISRKYILWSWIFQHLKDYISRLFFSFLFFFVFFFFDNCIFQAVREVKGQKMVSYDKKFLSFALHISGAIYHMIVIYGKLVWNDDCSRFFFIFSKFWFSGLLGPKWAEIMSVALHISRIIYHMVFIYDTHV